ncbi:SRPBCC family protein [Noviherbaspirillum malthae]|uniref:SRPBCC family protein n=1 Tax=Noviherbaspirillum malthae TaxID=1260987 RepID=UPI00189042E7|nr:SRPBCC family protein [Noviherbaspirillum malthae]
MSTVEKSVQVNVPVSTVYNQWTQFEEFPQFMEGVIEVRQLDPTRLHWRADFGGRTKEWEAEITEQLPDRRIAWRSISGAPNAGIVLFEDLGGSTRVTVQMDYAPQGIAENMAHVLGLLGRMLEHNLERFKTFIEARGRETGAWRGKVDQPHEHARG